MIDDGDDEEDTEEDDDEDGEDDDGVEDDGEENEGEDDGNKSIVAGHLKGKCIAVSCRIVICVGLIFDI